MLKGLALRQGLFALNGLLAFTLLLVVLLAGRELFRGGVNPGPVSEPDLSGVAAPLLDGASHSRDYYNVLITRAIFGDAGKSKSNEKTPEPQAPPPTADALETALPLRLHGTTLNAGPPALAAAIIEVREGGAQTKTFYLKDEVIENVFIQEIRRQEVILDNQRTRRTESLKVLWKSDPARTVASNIPAVRQGAAPAVDSQANLIRLDRAAITKKLEDEYARVASTLNVKVVNDENGKAKGITTDNIENYESAKELGLKNGDVLVSLNNEPVDSKERALEVLSKYKNASLFRVGILRNGQMQYLTYRVR